MPDEFAHAQQLPNANNLSSRQTSPSRKLPSEQLMTEDAVRRMNIIQNLKAFQGSKNFSQKKKEAARELGVTTRQIERLLKKYREQGLMAVVKTRSDKGKHRWSQEWIDFIIDTYKDGQKDGKRITRRQVCLQVKGRARKLRLDKYPSRDFVYSILNKYIEEEERKQNARSAGYSGQRLTHKTRNGEELLVEGSNDAWQCDHTKLDIMVTDEFGVLGRPWLTIIIDSYSRCVMGFFLGFYAPSSQVDALALRHAILPKSYDSRYELGQDKWETYGTPNYFYTDGGKDFTSIHITEQIATELDFRCDLRRRPSDGGIVERFFRTLKDQLLRTLPGYTGGNVEERPENPEKNASLTLQDLNILIVRYIVKEYNAHTPGQFMNQSRQERWKGGLMFEPMLYDELDLAVALMKEERRIVQKHGTLQCFNCTYHAESLRSLSGQTVALRYDPDDITTLIIYQINEDGTEEFLDYAYSKDLETQRLSLRQHQANRKISRQDCEETNNPTIQAMMEREELTQKLIQKNRQQRRQIAHEQVNPVQSIAEKFSISKSLDLEQELEEDVEINLEVNDYQVQYLDDFEED